jgi:16S rRNA (cytidine1402-2'-O)-methyltransferase
MASIAEPAHTGLGTLYLVPTPIGNVRDITLRAMDVLRSAAVVAAEDTRKARTLLRALDIEARLLSYYDFNEQARSVQLLRMLREGRDVALVTDAGTPLVNDPGYRIVTAAIEAGARVCPLPGASAVLTALIGSGLPAQRFEYAGFLPRKSAARQAAVAELAALSATLIFFEAPHRLRDTVADLLEVLGDRNAALARNLTKADEEFLRGPLSDIAAELARRGEVRGEYTVLVAGVDKPDTAASEELADRIAGALLRRDVHPHAVRDVVKEVTGLPRNQVYERVQLAQHGPAPALGEPQPWPAPGEPD